MQETHASDLFDWLDGQGKPTESAYQRSGMRGKEGPDHVLFKTMQDAVL